MNRNSRITIAGTGLLILLAAAQGCNSGNTAGGTVDNSGQYAPGDEGSIGLELTEGDTLGVGEIEGFRVFAKDQNGEGASDVRVICDTEQGLALIEPSNGSEHTDSNGQMSGQVGCETSGSYLIACRLQGASNKRKSETIKCTGPGPVNFGGFPGAGGGGLGGSKSEQSRASISSIQVFDDGSSGTSTTSIDTQQDTCVSSGTPSPEPFFDSLVKITVVNDSLYGIDFNSLRYSVSGPNGASGGSYTSPTLHLAGTLNADSSGGTVDINSLLFDASGGGKRFFGSGSNITTPGFRNITFTLTGINEIGQEITLTGSTNLSFDDFSRCTTS